MRRKTLGGAAVLAVLLGGLAVGGSTRETAAAAGGRVVGTVRLRGEAPRPEVRPNTKDTAQCGTEVRAEDLLVGPEKGIQHVVVSLLGAAGPAPRPATNPEMDQRGCRFAPRVVAVPAGGSLDFLNSDGILHNVRTTSMRNPSFNRAQPGFRKRMTERFLHPEIVKVTCDAHPWMTGWIVVTDHPYVAVTDAQGAFRLPDVPPGTYTLRIWHERLPEQTRDVTITAGGETRVTVEMAVP
jgi:plastocyanin